MTATTIDRPRRRARTRVPLTEEQRAQRRVHDKERIEQAVRELRSSDGWQAWLKVRAAFRRYSALNCMMIAMQCPHATRVAPIATWNRLGRHVLRGERAIAINVFKGAFTVEREDGTEDKVPRFQLKACLFDISQTDGDELPQPASEPIEGDSHAHRLPQLAALASEIGFELRYESVEGGARGYCDPTNKVIVVEHALPANARVRVLVHELAHALGIGYRDFGRARAETLVESITFIVCAGIGLDTSGESVPYVADWDDGDLAPLDEFAGAVDSIARRIEAVLHAGEEDASE